MPAPLLTDLDGVLRLWDPAILSSAEARHGLPPGALRAAVLDDQDALRAVTTGRVRDQEWRDGIARRLQERYGPGAVDAVRDWSRPAGEVDAAVLALLRRERRRGRVVAVLTNATDRLDADLRRLGLDSEVDVVFNSSELGVAKPDPEVFSGSARALGAAVADCLFVDDSLLNVQAAARLGMTAHHHVGAPALAAFLDQHADPGDLGWSPTSP